MNGVLQYVKFLYNERLITVKLAVSCTTPPSMTFSSYVPSTGIASHTILEKFDQPILCVRQTIPFMPAVSPPRYTVFWKADIAQQKS
jgi:hypothetical protein